MGIQFQIPGFLYGLPAVLIPVLLYLLFRKKRLPKRFSSFFILKYFAKTRMKEMRIRNILLIILRTLILLLILFLFAKPSLRTRAGAGNGSRERNYFFLLDDSYSMRSAAKDSTLFKNAKACAIGLLGSIPDGAGIWVYLTSGAGETNGPLTVAQAQQVLLSAEPSFTSKGIFDALASVSTGLENARHSASTIYLLSDFQEKETRALLQSELFKLVHEKYFADWVFFKSTGDGHSGSNRVWIDSVSFTHLPAGANNMLHLQAYYNAAAETDQKSIQSSIFLNDQKVWRKRVPLRAGHQTEQAIPVAVKEKGAVHGVMHLEYKDDLPEDNNIYFNFRNPPVLDVLIVSDEKATSVLLENVLKAGPRRRYAVRVEKLRNADKNRMETVDVLWLNNISRPTAKIRGLIQKRISKNLGTVISPGSSSDLSAYNRYLMGPLGLGQAVQPTNTDEGYFALSRLYPQHGLFSGFQRKISEEIRFLRYFGILPAPQVNIHAVFHNNVPFLIENRSLGGPVFLINGCISEEEYTDIASSSFFVPFVNRLMQAATGRVYQGRACFAGDTIRIPLAAQGAPVNPVVWKSLKNKKIIRYPLPAVLKQKEICLPPASEPGNYSLVYTMEETSYVSVNLNPAESVLNPLDDRALRTLLEPYDARFTRIDVETPGKIKESSGSRPLILYCMLLLLLAATAELLLTRKTAGG